MTTPGEKTVQMPAPTPTDGHAAAARMPVGAGRR